MVQVIIKNKPHTLIQQINVENKVVENIRFFLKESGYLEIGVPTLTPATGSCEVVDSMFFLDYFGSLAFPRQTGQLYLEEMVVNGLPAVYCEGQSLRKEWKIDDRHLTEFKLIEIERLDMSLNELCDFQEELVKYVAKRLSADDIGGRNVTRLDRVINSEHPRITYREAINILNSKGFSMKFGDDLDKAAEATLIRHIGNLPVHITHFPESLKFFNMKLHREDPIVVDCVDYILPYSGETFGGSLREPDVKILRDRLYNGTMYEHLMNRAVEFSKHRKPGSDILIDTRPQGEIGNEYKIVIQKSFEKYISLFENNPIERAGFGLGVARLIQFFMGLDSIKDAVVFPMDRGNFGGV